MSILNSPRLPDNPPDEFTAGDRNLARCADDRVSARVVRSTCEIEEIRKIWASWQQHPNADIDFYLLLARLRPEIIRPHVIVIYRRGRPDAMLIGRLMHGRIDLKLGYRNLLRPRARLLSFVYGGLLGNVSAENSQAMVAQVLNDLRQDEADAAVFNFVKADSLIYPLILNSPGFGCRDYFPTVQVHWNMRLPKTVEEFYRGLSPDHRAEIRRKTKKLSAEYGGNVRIACLRERADLDRTFRDVEEVAKKTYQRGLGVGFTDTLERRRIFDFETRKGWHRTYIMYVADEPCAFWMGRVCGATFYSGDIGYDPKYKRHSPGTFLFARMIEDFCSNGLQEVDFGLGDAEYKQRFGNYSWQEGSAYIFAPNPQGLRISALRTPVVLLDQGLRKAFGRTGLIPKIKKLWRERVRG